VQRVYPGQKINLIGTLLAVLAFGITGEMTVNLIGCLITGAGILPSEGRFLVSHTVRTAILIGLLSGLRHSHPTVCRPLRCCAMGNLSNISWSVNRVDWLRFGESFVRGIMTIPEEGFPSRVYVGESDRHGPIYGKDSAFVRGCFDGG
jgi:hypothetical protein